MPSNSISSYGSKFKSPKLLEELFRNHPRWLILKNQLINGVSFPLRDLPKDVYYKDLIGAVKRGNHKSAEKHSEELHKSILKEIKFGWMIPLKASDALKIPGI